MIDWLQKKYANSILKPFLIWYLKKPRITHIKGFQLLIKPTVFHPKFFFSSQYLFDFVLNLNLEKKTFLEIGCGSGLISFLAYKKKASVTCCDINELAVECTNHNFELNFKATKSGYFNCIKSDVFDNISNQVFDVIMINPPYFFSEVGTKNQLAWNCGLNGEYFIKLFSQLKKYASIHTQTYMILADNCEIERIKKIAHEHQLQLQLVEEHKIKWEKNFIFKISHFN